MFYRHPRFWVEIFHAALAGGVYTVSSHEQGSMFIAMTAVGIAIERVLYHIFLHYSEPPITSYGHINHSLKEHTIRKRLYLGKEVKLSPDPTMTSVS